MQDLRRGSAASRRAGGESKEAPKEDEEGEVAESSRSERVSVPPEGQAAAISKSFVAMTHPINPACCGAPLSVQRCKGIPCSRHAWREMVESNSRMWWMSSCSQKGSRKQQSSNEVEGSDGAGVGAARGVQDFSTLVGGPWGISSTGTVLLGRVTTWWRGVQMSSGWCEMK
jgi:hypothetical protein